MKVKDRNYLVNKYNTTSTDDGKGNNYTTPFGNQVYHSQIKFTK
jgi:hypothetical protein